MSRTERAERAEPADDMRGNGTAPYDPSEGDDWWPHDFVAGEYLPMIPPTGDRERNAIIIRALATVLYESGYTTIYDLVRATVDRPVYDLDEEIFDLLVVLSREYKPGGWNSTAERDALFETVPLEESGNSLVAEFCGDAMMCMGMGEPPEEAMHFLLSDNEGEGEWDEMRVSFRVAIEQARIERVRERERAARLARGDWDD